MPGEYWVSFDFDEDEARRLEDATGAFDERIGGVITKEPSDGTANVVFQVRADSPETAWGEAVELYGQLRVEAGLAEMPPLAGTVHLLRELPPEELPPAEPPAPPKPPPEPPPHNRWLEKAMKLLRDGCHDGATVAAQTAIEVAIEDTLLKLIAQKYPELQVALAALTPKRFTLLDSGTRLLWNRLTDADIQKSVEWEVGDFWTAYRGHWDRRNRVVHSGKSVAEPEAQESVKLAITLCAYVIGFAPLTRP
jgi:hypothetical protein